jgi:hypothetical protein
MQQPANAHLGSELSDFGGWCTNRLFDSDTDRGDSVESNRHHDVRISGWFSHAATERCFGDPRSDQRPESTAVPATGRRVEFIDGGVRNQLDSSAVGRVRDRSVISFDGGETMMSDENIPVYIVPGCPSNAVCELLKYYFMGVGFGIIIFAFMGIVELKVKR